jgi:alkanesulfonate monooxygenase SsuD/methylene tetrahydromethanopterin reductase-like flavin-dependent oxidoreductase (luciferase family)
VGKRADSGHSLISTGGAWKQAGHSPHQLKVGIHSLGYVAESTQEAVEDFFPGYAHTMTEIGKERGWPKLTRASFDAQRGPQGALFIGDPDEIVDKIIRHSKALGDISRVTFMMNPASLSHVKLMRAIKLIGIRVAPALCKELG